MGVELSDVESKEPKDADLPVDVAKGSLAKDIEQDEHFLEKYDQQLRDIEMETKQVPLVGDRRPFVTLMSEYDPQEAPEFYFKAQDLSETYESIRPIRRDGNCFYRSILVAQVEHILKNPDELKRFNTVCRGWLDRLLKLGFSEVTTTDFCDSFYEFLDGIVKGETTLEKALQMMNRDETANYYIIFFRIISSGYLKEHSEEYAPFVDCGKTLAEFCEQEIECMWKDVDHLAITGLVAAIGISIRVEYLDQSAAPDGGVHYDFPPDSGKEPDTVLLYRPGHYDLIYKKK